MNSGALFMASNSRIRKWLKWIAIVGATLLGALAIAVWHYGGRLGHASFWESEIAAFEADDKITPKDPGAILFTGSSSIRMWSTLERDMAPMRVLNRGFGGAHMEHVLYFADRIITPYAPRAIVLYVGDNDIGADKTPAIVENDFLDLVAHIRKTQPNVPIYFLTIKASRLRWSLWPTMNEANERIVALAESDPLIRVIDVSAPMVELGAGGKPPADLFRFDGLHLSEAGYALWTKIVRARLLEDLGPG